MTARSKRICLIPALAAILAIGASPPRKLIEFGWDEPDTAFLRQHIREMEKTPFDGCVFHANAIEKDGKTVNFAWHGWGRRAFPDEALRPALDDLQATRLGSFANNFLRINTTPADVDWFDNFAAILGNVRLAARLAREGKCRGILLDVEQYEGKLFDYRKQRDASTKSWDVYAHQVRRRGQEVMATICREFPDVTVLLTFGHSYPWKQSEKGTIPLASCEYGLLAPFLDGMIEATEGIARLVDAYELSYGFRDPLKIAEARRTVLEGVLPIVARPDAYRKTVSVGFGLWLDYDWPKYGWDVDDLSKNYFTPAAFEASARKALEMTDEYVWIYTEKPRWWTETGPPSQLPAPYVEALRKAKQGGIPLP